MAKKSTRKEILFKKAYAHIKKANKYCIDYAQNINKNIPQESCDKSRLIAIVLADGITQNDEIISALHSKLDYLADNWGSSEGLDAQAYESYCHCLGKYDSMISAIKKYLKE